jgi:YfiH family protein
MIRPQGFAGAFFGTAEAGDLRSNSDLRARVAGEIGIDADWAYLNQVHGAVVRVARNGGNLGDGDAIMTSVPGLAIMVATADCVPIIIEGDDAVAVVHAGWRGALAGVLEAALTSLRTNGFEPLRAAIGPAIGPCCYEVGDEVAARFPGFVGETTWGSTSVDIPGFLENRLAGLEVWRSNECTYTAQRMNSWRRDRTRQRQVAVAWLPNN